ncbi:hypothetical protein PTTG_28844 [Puccinia triticina 1-1 BBBD Race 1]|uniref:Uncharacterized protein n=1 Tax=Puccinia triticina (isolate 1-1 / race 1 (BBBD)) TaxID=630390 RepID=A0A180G8P4_PUCT1|nr:hypothetical protein PTTG_28844 [Puccinia triticina 1-1 BBBD Race 1]
MTVEDPIHLEPVIGQDQDLLMEDVEERENKEMEKEDVPKSLFEELESDDEEGELNWMNMIGIAIGQVKAEPEETSLDASNPLSCQEEAIIKNVKPNSSAWYPFPNQEYLVGSLLIGYLHKLISRDMYHQVRVVFTLYHVKLPQWEALRQMRTNIWKLFDRTIFERETIFGQPVFGLNPKDLIKDDLMNPLVAPHLEFVPEEAHRHNIYKLSQSAKWLKHLDPDLRVQMVKSNQKHFYILEPVQLKNLEIVIPVFFHTENSALFARCYKKILKSNSDHSQIKIRVAANPAGISYDDAALQTISVDQFSLVYDEITLKNGLKLFDCCGKKIMTDNGSETPFPNEWSKKAGGKILRNVPITLYSDNTSGNKSKKWNKHISYYFTLSGLPPKISNQQFNCHFLCTTNITGPLELGEMVVEQLNDMATHGFSAYDSTIGEEVHVMTSMLCFLGDSPMHAKITNTHVPGNSLNSCRYCVLHSATLQDRKKMPYVGQFMQKNLHGANCLNQLRTMEQTTENSKKLWECAKEPSMTLEKYNTRSAKLAVRDQINIKFAKQLFNFEEEKIAILQADEELPPHMDQPIPQVLVLDMEKNDTPVEALHVIFLGAVKYLFRDFMKTLDEDQKTELLALWYSFNTNSLNIPSIRPTSMVQYSKSLIGKDFRIVLQAAPFLFFRFMTPSRVKIWSALCHMSALIFQTLIEDMDSYISDLRMHIDIFLKHIVEDSAQWVNKAKFHMLLHLPESILRFGPPSLFATEKFESFNGILRNASIHSNRQSPGQDIAITFSSYHCFRQTISGGFFFDKKLNKFIQSSNQVQNIFKSNPLIQQSLGYNQDACLPVTSYPSIRKRLVPEIDQVEPPQHLKNAYPEHEYNQILELNLNKKQVLEKGYFILFNVKTPQNSQRVGRVNSIWKVQKLSQQSMFVHTTVFQKMAENSFYRMREVCKTAEETCVNSSSIETGLNVQHNCHDGDCQLTKSRTAIVERRVSSKKSLELTHRDDDRFIINLASLSSVNWHRKFSNITLQPITQLEWIDAMHNGLDVWHSVVEKNETKKTKKNKKKAAATGSTDPDLAE